jgi:hypothetical protein
MTGREQKIFIETLSQPAKVRAALALGILESLDGKTEKRTKTLIKKRSKK